MNLKEFIDKYDKEGSVVLLEGKREVLPEDKEKLIELGRIIASNTTHMIFRSGNAEGSDFLFSSGVIMVNPKRLQVITPYSGHRKKHNQAGETISLDEINLLEEPKVIYQSKTNKKTEKNIDPYLSGIKNSVTMNAAYIIRDTIKAVGTKKISPATFGIFYDDLKNPKTGGTGHTMNTCINNKIPIIDQRIWFGWI